MADRAAVEFLTVHKEPIICPRCNRLHGNRIGPLFYYTSDHRFVASNIPGFIVCEKDCGGVWRNPDWPEELVAVVLYLRDNLPDAELPPIRWELLPNNRRPARFRDRT